MTSSRFLSTRSPGAHGAPALARPLLQRGVAWAWATRAACVLALVAALVPARGRAGEDERTEAHVAVDGTAERPTPPPEPPAVDELVPTFPQATARYLGVTDLGPDAIGLDLPSALERYELLLAPHAALDSRIMVRAPPAPIVTKAPRPRLRLEAGGGLSQAWEAPGAAYGATGWKATAGGPGPVRGRVSLTTAQEIRGTTSGGAPASRFGTRSSASLQVRVADPVSLTAEVHEISERGATDAVSTGGARAGAVIGLVPKTLELTASAGVDRVHTALDSAMVDRTSATATLTAHLTPALTLSGSESIQTGELTWAAGAAQLFPLPAPARITSGTAQWRRGERLQLTLTLYRLATATASGLARQVRAAWAPVPGGRLRVAAAYEESIDGGTGSRVGRAILQPSFRLTRTASLDASWTDTLQPEGGRPAHAQTFLVSFSVRS